VEVSGEDTYFGRNFPLSSSDGSESDYAGLTGYFASIHAAFDDRKITRRSVVAEDCAVEMWIEATFVRVHPVPRRPASRDRWQTREEPPLSQPRIWVSPL
jgi:hypothetical protein